MPSLDDFFSVAIEQADPANMVEDEYKYKNKITLFPRGALLAPFLVSCVYMFVWLWCFFL